MWHYGLRPATAHTTTVVQTILRTYAIAHRYPRPTHLECQRKPSRLGRFIEYKFDKMDTCRCGTALSAAESTSRRAGIFAARRAVLGTCARAASRNRENRQRAPTAEA